MKKYIIILLFFCVWLCGHAQKYFNNLYDYNLQVESFNSIIQVIDSGYLAVGVSKKNGVGYNYYALRTDKNGNKIYESYIEVPQTEIILSSIKRCNDSVFIACGIIMDLDSTSLRYNRDVLMVKMTINGDTLWTKRFRLAIGTAANPDFEAGQEVIVTSDNGFAVLGYTSNSVNLGYQIYLIKTDSDGNLQWQKTYGGANTDVAFAILESIDKGFIMSGYTLSYGAGDRDGYVLKTDSLGNLQWQKTYGNIGSDGTGGITKSLEGGYLLAGWTNTNLSQSLALQPWIIKIDGTGNQQWDKKFGSSKTRGDLEKIIQLQDSSYIAIGGIKDTLGMPNAGYILKTNVQGDSLWAREYKRSTTVDDYIYNFNTTNDGGFILVGTVSGTGSPNGTQDGWLIKVDCWGADSITHYFGNSCYNGSITGIKEIVIDYDVPSLMDNYPNPFNEITTISYYLPETKTGSITVTDLTGRALKQFNLSNGINRIDFKATDLNNGIYFYSMYVEGKIHSTKKMILLK